MDFFKAQIIERVEFLEDIMELYSTNEGEIESVDEGDDDIIHYDDDKTLQIKRAYDHDIDDHRLYWTFYYCGQEIKRMKLETMICVDSAEKAIPFIIKQFDKKLHICSKCDTLNFIGLDCCKDDLDECSICKCGMKKKDIIKTKCKHEFHRCCLTKARERSDLCPLCRRKL